MSFIKIAAQQARQQGLAIVSDVLTYNNSSGYINQGVTIKQEIQIPQVSSLTSSPDSSPSPLAPLGMVGAGQNNINLPDPKLWAASSTSPNPSSNKSFAYDSSNNPPTSNNSTMGSSQSGSSSSQVKTSLSRCFCLSV